MTSNEDRDEAGLAEPFQPVAYRRALPRQGAPRPPDLAAEVIEDHPGMIDGPEIHELLASVMDMAHARSVQGEARYVAQTSQDVTAGSGDAVRSASDESEGVGIRLRGRDCWGFAATSDLSRRGIEVAFRNAFDLVDPSPTTSSGPLPGASEGSYETRVEKPPWDVRLTDKIALLLEATSHMLEVPGVVSAESRYRHAREHRCFANTSGLRSDQRVVWCGGGIEATASDGSEYQRRTYPSCEGNFRQAGYEHFLELDLPGEAHRVAEEAVALLSAPECPAGEMTVVLHGEQVGLQLHESVGHALELDRVLGTEAGYAGTSFVEPSDRGFLRYGSQAMNVVTDPTCEGGLGTSAFDDEGTSTQPTTLVRDGVLVGFLSSRESAKTIGASSSAAMRADGWQRQPIVRMSNLCLEPGNAEGLDQLVGDTDEGVYLETNRSLSIDDRRLGFQFSTEIAREIHRGRFGRLLKNPVYHGRTPVFWAGLESVAGAADWKLWSVTNCGKGEPAQLVCVSHGAAPARFRDVSVGSFR